MVWTLRVTRLSYQDHPSPYSSTYGQSLRKVLLGLRQDLSIKAAILSALPIMLWNLSNLAQRMLLAECTLSMMNIYQPYRGWLEQKKKTDLPAKNLRMQVEGCGLWWKAFLVERQFGLQGRGNNMQTKWSLGHVSKYVLVISSTC